MSPETLDLLWRCAVSPGAIPILTGDDVADLSPQEFKGLRDLGLLRPGDTAGHVVCRECAENHIMEVTAVKYPDGAVRFFGMCPKNGRVEVPRERLLQWTVDFAPVLAWIMTALESPGRPKVVVPGRVWDLGRAALAGQSRPVWAARGMAWPDAVGVAQAVPKGRSPVVFVLGTAPEPGVLTAPSDAIIDLRTVVHLDAGVLTLDSKAVESQLHGSPPEAAAKKPRKRASRAAAIDAIKKALRAHLRAARDRAFVMEKRTGIPELLPRPTQQQLADQLNLSVSAVCRALSDRSDPEISILWNIANDIDQVMNF